MKPKIDYKNENTPYAFFRLLNLIKNARTATHTKYTENTDLYSSPYYSNLLPIKNEKELKNSLPYIRFKVESGNTMPSKVGTVFEIVDLDFVNGYVHAHADNHKFKIKFSTLAYLTICDETTPLKYSYTKGAKPKVTTPSYVPQYDAKGQEIQINQTVIFWDHYIEDYLVGKVIGFTQKFTAVYIETKALFSSSTYAKHTTKYPVSSSRYKNIKIRTQPKKLIIIDQDISDTVLEILLSA